MNKTEAKKFVKQARVECQDASGPDAIYDFDIDPIVLTDKDDTKTTPCRKCKRVCVVTRFATANKVECTDCRETAKKAKPVKIREFDESLGEHVLTDKEKTKRIPCRNCGRPCVVNTFATPDKVACMTCRKYVPRSVRTRETETSTGRVEAKPHMEIDTNALIKITRPALPYWPAGSDADRELLTKLAIAHDEADAAMYQERLDYAALCQEYSPTEKDEDSPAKPPHPTSFREAEATLTEAKLARRDQRQKMVDKLKADRNPVPYLEVRDADALAIERRPTQRYLERCAAAGV